MKKNLFIVLSAMLTCIMLTVGIILSVCGVFKTDGERGNNSIHIHDYKDEWRTDGEFHWHECTAAGCDGQIMDKTAHTDADGDEKCDVCGFDMHRHILTPVEAKQATCTAEGNAAYYVCGACNKLFSDAEGNEEITDTESVVIPRKPHNYVNGSCTGCNAKHDCKYIETVTEPTCTEQGFTTYVCSCGLNYKDDYKEKLEHDYFNGKCRMCSAEHDCRYTDAVTDPTCDKQGYTSHTCECGRRYYDNITDPIGHNYIDGECSRCGKFNYTTGLDYTLSDDGKYYICTGIGKATEKDIIFPSKYNGKPVTAIKDNAFEESKLTSVTIPESINDIGICAFHLCKELKSVTFLDGVSQISQYSFYWCTGLTTLTIPDSVVSVGEGAFENCANLKSINVGKGLTSIGKEVFIDCESLESITVSKENTKYYSMNNCLIEIESNKLILGCKNSIIPDGVTAIGKYAFYGCKRLTSVNIPDSVTIIGDYAFYDCSGLEGLTIPAGVINIGISVIGGCNNLANLQVAVGNTKYHSTSNCIIETESKTLILGCKTSVIPDDGSVTSIGDYAFISCKMLEKLIIPEGITSIGNHSLQWCNKLQSVTLPDSVNFIGEYAFYGCRYLTAVDIPDGVTFISEFAFDSCSSIESVTLPASVTSIGRYAFSWCKSLKNIYFDGTVAEWESIKKGEEWDSSTGNYVVHCKDGSYSDNGTAGLEYTLSDDGTYYVCTGIGTAAGNEIVIPSVYNNLPVGGVGERAFKDRAELKSVVISYGITDVGLAAFQNCIGLTEIAVPDSVTKIGNYAFYSCVGLTQITVPAGVETLESYTFASCQKLRQINFKGTVAEWNAIPHTAWLYISNCTVQCTDGNVIAGR